MASRRGNMLLTSRVAQVGDQGATAAGQAVRWRAATRVPRADHDVAVVAHRRAREHGGGLRRMLQVGVHHQHPLAACVPRAGDDGAAQTALPGARPSVQQADRYRAGRAWRGQGLGVSSSLSSTTMISALNEATARPETLQERSHVAFLVARRDDHGQVARAVARAVEFQWSGWLPVRDRAQGLCHRLVRPGGDVLAPVQRSTVTTHISAPGLCPVRAEHRWPRDTVISYLSCFGAAPKYRRHLVLVRNDRRGAPQRLRHAKTMPNSTPC